MTPDKIKLIAGYTLSSIDSVLNRYIPGGKREGHEYLPVNPRRADSSPGSFSINLNNGKWSDFASGDKGLDIVSLVAYLEDCTQSQAAELLAGFLNIQIDKNDQQKHGANVSKSTGKGNASPSIKKPGAAKNTDGSGSDGWQFIMPVPDNAPKPPETHSRHGRPSIRYPYIDRDGRVNFYHDRYEKGAEEKNNSAR